MAAPAIGVGPRRSGGTSEFQWEREFERPWQALKEGADGRLVDASGAGARARGGVGVFSAANRDSAAPLQRGLLRHVILVIDLSAAPTAVDMAPSRAGAVVGAASVFVSAFFDSNPISSLGLFTARDGVATKVCDLTGNSKTVRAALKEAAGTVTSPLPCSGSFSFEYVLRATTGVLSLHPNIATREVIILHSALASVDPGDVFAALADAVTARVRVSVLSLAGEVFLAARVAADSGGAYNVPENVDGLRSMLLAHCAPPARRAADALEAEKAGPTPVGFPMRHHEAEALCACHHKLRSATYECPRCSARACDVPSQCAVCGLRLLSALALARSYHLIFPVVTFFASKTVGGSCAACQEPFALNADADRADASSASASDARECPTCGLRVCIACDDTIHHDLHVCPGCC